MRNKRSIFVFLSIVIAFFAAGIITEIFLPVRSILFSVLSPPYTGIEKGSALLAGELGIISFKSDVALREAKKKTHY